MGGACSKQKSPRETSRPTVYAEKPVQPPPITPAPPERIQTLASKNELRLEALKREILKVQGRVRERDIRLLDLSKRVLENKSDDVANVEVHELDRESRQQGKDLDRLAQLRNQALLLEDAIEANSQAGHDNQFYDDLENFTSLYQDKIGKREEQYTAYRFHLEWKERFDAMVDRNPMNIDLLQNNQKMLKTKEDINRRVREKMVSDGQAVPTSSV